MPAQTSSDDQNSPVDDMLLKKQQQIAAKASEVSVSGDSFPTEKPVEDSKIPTDAKAVDSKQDVKIQDEKPSEPVVGPVKLESAEPPKEITTLDPLPTTTSSANPNAVLELTKADIFKLLGMSQVPETEKKKNLDEMEETIWQDFVEEDLPKMLKPDEKGRFEDLLKTAPSAEKVINFFGSPPSGGLPSDFEEKYLAKTLEFKAEIAKEQIETLLEAVDDPAKKGILQKAKDLAAKGFWKQVEDLMVTFG